MKPVNFPFKSLILALGTLAAVQSQAKSYVDVYVVPAASPVYWNSPASLAKSFFRNSVSQKVADTFDLNFRSAVGHASAKIHCEDEAGDVTEVYSGFSGQESQDDSYDLLVKKKTGLKILFHHFEDGYVESEEDVQYVLTHVYARTKRHSPHFMRFQMTNAQCQKALDVHETFKDVMYEEADENVKALPADEKLYYGFGIDAFTTYKKRLKNPTSPLGATCSSYVVALLKAAGVYDSSLDLFWKRKVTASIDKIGGVDPQTHRQFEFGVMDFLSEKAQHWVTPGLPTVTVELYEPEKMWSFINSVSYCLQSKKCEPAIQKWLQRGKGKAVTTTETRITGQFERINYNSSITGDKVERELIPYTQEVVLPGIEASGY